MFKKILIANRGEIACRIIRSARAMGIRTVAVYSDADDGALHMRMADEAVHIGGAPAAESYLLADRIIAACRDTGADAVHPGFGFLSENAAFVESLKEAGIAFIGPDTRAIAAMGDKIESKKLAEAAGVNTVPGHTGAIADADEAVRISREIGYPVMIKASAGGGGKGMRVAYDDEEAREGFTSAVNEARSSFGDDRVFIEKFIEEPRHIEIQVLGDKHGNCIYLGERECSIQRRHQKVIEEAPSPFIDEQTRRAMGEQAVRLAAAVDYSSAGTVEFIVDGQRNFYFLEMNTRLQVEHPVTEYITGIDLVEQMIRVAAGEKLAIGQEDVRLTGWAVESRIYAEDPYRGFLPSTGRLSRFRPPAEGKDVRIDTGVEEGSEISMFYDPMIAKLITYGEDRAAALARMEEALNSFDIDGIAHNIDFLNAVIRHPRFREGRLSTNFIAEEYPDGFRGAPLAEAEQTALVVLMAHIDAIERHRARRIEGQTMSRPLPVRDERVVICGDDHFDVAVEHDGAVIALSGKHHAIRSDYKPGGRLVRADIGDRHMVVKLHRKGVGYSLNYGGATLEGAVYSPRGAELASLMPYKAPPDLSKFLLCPMPGLVVSIAVEEGEEVKAGQALAVVEAMKMENVLRAEQEGTVKAIRATAGDSLGVDDVIIEFE